MLCELLRGAVQLGRNSFVQQAPRSFKHVSSLTQVTGKHQQQQLAPTPIARTTCRLRECRSLDCPVFFFLPLKKPAARFPDVRLETAFRMAWACPSCTFLNITGVSVCEVCSRESSSSATAATASKVPPGWACVTCTFLNTAGDSVCEMCGTDMPSNAEQQRQQKPLPLHSDLVTPEIADPIPRFRPLRSKSRPKPPAGASELLDDVAPEEVLKTKASGTQSSSLDNAKAMPYSSSSSSSSFSRKRKAAEEDEGNPPPSLSNCSKDEEKNSRSGGGSAPKDGELETVITGVLGDPGSTNSILKLLHLERMSRMKDNGTNSGKEKISVASTSASAIQSKTTKAAEGPWLRNCSTQVVILSYNVWFREDLQLEGRMEAIGELILQHQPHIICFQEVTENIYAIFQQSSWWKQYQCSVSPDSVAMRGYFCMQLSKLPVDSFYCKPFRNSVMGRELCVANVDVGNGTQLTVATTHLESPCPAPPTWNQMFSAERVVQAKEALALLKDVPNAIFGGDMNWDDKQDGKPPLPPGWFDAWLQLCPHQPGLTYDSKANPMLKGSRLQKRLDRIYCQLHNFEVESIEMVGTTPIPDLTFQKELKVKKQVELTTLPVLPSDHFGLLLKMRHKSK
ncbi:hypothetical protein BDL97_02G086300 [Sphagnum fallax]|nr:hypothetical protein BDL97_02G086300 [Sphagnum fallax]